MKASPEKNSKKPDNSYSLPFSVHFLPGMAGLYGLRPAPAMPGEEMDREGYRTRIVRFLAIFLWRFSCMKLFWRLFLRLFGRFLVHFEVLLGLCWGYVDPPEVILEPCCFHEFIFIPKFCLKKLFPVACEAPTPFLHHHFSEKVEPCLERAHPRWAPEGSHQWPARGQRPYNWSINYPPPK